MKIKCRETYYSRLHLIKCKSVIEIILRKE